jgi:hypothetical protein
LNYTNKVGCEGESKMTNTTNEPSINISCSSEVATKKTNPRSMLDNHANAIIEKLIERALAGDLTTLRLCVERILSRTKPDNSIGFELPDGRIDSADNMLTITNSITNAVTNGEMTIDEAEKFNDFLKEQRWLISKAEDKKKDEQWKKERGW